MAHQSELERGRPALIPRSPLLPVQVGVPSAVGTDFELRFWSQHKVMTHEKGHSCGTRTSASAPASGCLPHSYTADHCLSISVWLGFVQLYVGMCVFGLLAIVSNKTIF